MSNQLKVNEQKAIIALKRQGFSQRRAAATLGLNRETVARYWRAGDPAKPAISTPGVFGPESKPAISTPGVSGRKSRCEPLADFIKEKAALGLTAQRIYQDLVVEGKFSGSYQSVKRFVRQLRQAEPQRVWRIEVQPGEEAQVDFGLGIPVPRPEGGQRRVWVFRLVLSYSRKGYSEAVFHQNTESFIRCLENAFRALGGVPRCLNLDNLKAAVLKADWADPDLNPKLEEFCRHYGTFLLPCKPRTPEHKGKTESGIRYVKSNGLAGRRFDSLAAENAQLVHWERTVADVRVHGTTRQQVGHLFAAVEKSSLLPLPPALFPCYSEGQRDVHRDSCIIVERAYYAVPQEYIGQSVWARWDAREVRVFNLRWEQILFHRRLEPGQFSEALGVGGGRGTLQANLDYWVARAGELGAPCAQWSQGLVQQRGPAAIRSLMGLAALTRQHTFQAVNQACARALSHNLWRLKDVRAFLHNPAVQTHLPFVENHPLIRNLREYGLFITGQNS